MSAVIPTMGASHGITVQPPTFRLPALVLGLAISALACGAEDKKKQGGGVADTTVTTAAPTTTTTAKAATTTTAKPATTSTTAKTVSYANRAAVKAAGAAPIRRGDPGYSSRLDRDGDGIACEN